MERRPWQAPEDLPYEESIPAQLGPDSGTTIDAQALLGRLPAREREVLTPRFGLDGERERTLEQIGDLLGVTRQRADQIVRQALERLRGGAAA